MANLITNTRQWMNKALLVKEEVTYGVDSTPTGAANWIEARNVSLTPLDADKIERNIDLPYLGNAGSILVSYWAKLSFDVAAAPSGVAGTAPKWGVLHRACGMAETVVAVTSVAYNLISSAFPSVVAYMNIDGTLHKLIGMRGEVKGKMSAKGTAIDSYSFDACYVTPVTGALPAVTRTGWMVEEGVNSVNTLPFTLNGVALAFSSLDWSLGNKISRSDLAGPQREITIDGRTPQATVTVLAPALAVFNPFALAESQNVVAATTTHGSAAGKKFRLDMNGRLVGVDYDKIDGKVAYKLTLDLIPVLGNDEWARTCL